MIWLIKNGTQTVYGPAGWSPQVMSEVVSEYSNKSISLPAVEPSAELTFGTVKVSPTDPLPDTTDYMKKMRVMRDWRISEIYWRVERNITQIAGSITPDDDATKMTAIYTYLQALRDMPSNNPNTDTKAKYDALVWPTKPA